MWWGHQVSCSPNRRNTVLRPPVFWSLDSQVQTPKEHKSVLSILGLINGSWLLRSPHLHLSSARLFWVFPDQALERSILCLYISACSVLDDTLSKGSLFAALSPESCYWVHTNRLVTEGWCAGEELSDVFIWMDFTLICALQDVPKV